jgi:hypothetical protein
LTERAGIARELDRVGDGGDGAPDGVHVGRRGVQAEAGHAVGVGGAPHVPLADGLTVAVRGAVGVDGDHGPGGPAPHRGSGDLLRGGQHGPFHQVRVTGRAVGGGVHDGFGLGLVDASGVQGGGGVGQPVSECFGGAQQVRGVGVGQVQRQAQLGGQELLDAGVAGGQGRDVLVLLGVQV